jgi:TPR repeat protein
MQWFRKAADKGYVPAQLRLGYGYLIAFGQDAGQGKQDYSQAAHWFTMASQQGNHIAQLELAILYETGRGVTQDLQKAKGLYSKVASSSIPEVANKARELGSTGPFADSSSASSSGSQTSRSTQGDSDWVGPALGIAATVVGLQHF